MSGPVDVLARYDNRIASADALSADGFYAEELLRLQEERAAVAELIWKADTVATVLSNLIAARQVDARYGDYVTDLTAAIANAGGAK